MSKSRVRVPLSAHYEQTKEKELLPEMDYCHRFDYRSDRRNQYHFLFWKSRPDYHPRSDYIVFIDKLEELTDMDFFSALPDETEEQIENKEATRLPEV